MTKPPRQASRTERPSVLRIHCPYCGFRDQTEFRYGKDADVTRPTGTSPEAWARYLYWPRNPDCVVVERWLHVSGCCRWLVVRRDLGTDAILDVCELRKRSLSHE